MKTSSLLLNISESLKAIMGNKLRSGLTASIIAIGITALIGILTSLSGIGDSVRGNLSSLGSENFDIEIDQMQGRRRSFGAADPKNKAISLREALAMRRQYPGEASVVSVYAAEGVTVKSEFGKTNPNCSVAGAAGPYVDLFGYKIGAGRNLTIAESEGGAPIAIIGFEVANTCLPGITSLKDVYINVGGTRLHVIGVLAKTGGSFGGSGADRLVLTPMNTGLSLANKYLSYSIRIAVSKPMMAAREMQKAEQVFRGIRHDRPGYNSSFTLIRNETLASRISSIESTLEIGGLVIGLITLAGAAIGLMNIMIVSVSERTREIGVRKSLGATPAVIRQQFLTESIMICIMGNVMGVVFGLIVGNVVSRGVGSEGFAAPLGWIGFSLVLSVIVGVVSGYYPARKAAQLDPIDALRYE